MEEKDHEKMGAAKLSIFANLVIIILKIVVALFTGSLGILADSIHSLLDLVASLFCYVGIRKASEPSDDTHHYGHDRFENLSSIIQSILLGITSFSIFYEAYAKLSSGNHVVTSSVAGIFVMLITLAIDFKVSQYLHKKSAQTNSTALEADAFHFTADMYSAVAVIIGLAATALGYPIADIIAAVAVALIMLYISLNIGKESTLVLLDQAPADAVCENIASVILKHPGITSYHSLRARISGRKISVDVSVHMDPKLSLFAAHKIAESLEQNIIANCPNIKEVVVHMEPDAPHDSGLEKPVGGKSGRKK